MSPLSQFFANNRAWAEKKRAENPRFFEELAEGQNPSYLWIGCSDSRVPPGEIVGVSAGDLFVHRNIANIVEPSDINCLSVIQFAVDVLDVERIIVCGHYGCGGVAAAMGTEPLGVIDAWLARIREVRRLHAESLAALPDEEARFRRLCELNVLEQAVAACYSPAVQTAWRQGRGPVVHALIYDMEDGLLQDEGFTAGPGDDVEAIHDAVVAAL